MSERAPQPLSPADYLFALQDFLVDTSNAVREQITWRNTLSKFLGPLRTAEVDTAINTQIAENVAQASQFIQSLGQQGLSFVVVSQEGDRHPMVGLGFEPTIGLYEVGVPTPQGPTLVPLTDAFHLEICPPAI